MAPLEKIFTELEDIVNESKRRRIKIKEVIVRRMTSPIPWFALGDAIESKQIEKIPKEFLEKEILELKFPEQKEPSCLKIAVIQGVLHKLPKEEISLKGLLREDTIYFLKNEEAEILKFFSGKEILENENKIKEVLKMKTPKLSSTQRKGLVSLLKRGQEYQIIKAEKAINL